MQYRHEMKYICSKAQAKCIISRLKVCMKPDPHLSNRNSYTVRSLYYDTWDDKALQDNLAGIEPRGKWRIRTYDLNLDVINLEYKGKEHGLTYKCSCSLDQNHNAMKMRFENALHCNLLQPKVIVQYDRVPYIYEVGDVRVTVDYNISRSYSVEHFFEENINFRPILPTAQCILEVKWTGVMPMLIKHLLSGLDIRWTTFSKYQLCRCI